VTDDELTRLSFQQHPQQVLALFPIPEPADLSPLTSHLSLLLDGVQDPGNLGTIIRIADWFGISNIICSEDTVDAYNPKVVQATMGSIARVNIIYTNLLELLDGMPANFPVYGTLLDGENIYTQELTPHGLIIMGNEGNGISDAVRQRVNRRLLIPDFHNGDTADSLNVAIATAITCSEFRRRQ
jgi:TrmH family RNA methyltransferase